MTVINPNSISVITSITLPAGADNVLTIHTNDGTERFRIDSSGNVKVGSACTISQDGDVFFTGVTTATTFTGAHSGSGANLTSLPAAQITGTLPAISAANLTNVPAANITGTLPVIDGSNLTGIGGTDFIHAEQISVSGVTTSQTFIPSQGQLSNRNIMINGAMNVAQRGTSSTSVGYKTCDRWYFAYGGENEAPTQAQADLSSSDTPYSFGFRKSYKITNGNQTSTDAADYLVFYTALEAQDLANSGWNYTSTSSYITLSFWAKSSVAKTFDVKLTTNDGTAQQFNHQFALSANTWKKVEIPIPGNSNITINNDNGKGVEIQWDMYSGTNYTSGSTVDQWVTYNGNTSAPDQTADWWTTNDATFELTGVQLEVGQVATPFEHRSIGKELKHCKRYYEQIQPQLMVLARYSHHDGNGYIQFYFEVEKRSAPSGSYTGSFVSSNGYAGNPQFSYNDASITQAINIQGSNSITAGGINYLHGDTSDPGICKFDAEL